MGTPSAPRAARSAEIRDRADARTQIVVGETEMRLQLLHPLVELHQCTTHSLDLVVRKASRVDAPEGLSFQQLAYELDHGHHQLNEAAFDVVSVHAETRRRCRPRWSRRRGVRRRGS